MSEPIKSKRLSNLAGAPTPQNTPATAASSFATRLGGANQPSVATIAEEGGAEGKGGIPDTLALLQSIQGGLNNLVGMPSGYIDSLPAKVQDRVRGLKALQAEHSKLDAQFHKELLDLERKYLGLYRPIYNRRANIIKGDEEPTHEEIEFGKAIEEEDEDEEEDDDDDEEEDKDQEQDKEEDDEDDDVKGIPYFWLTALTNLASVSDLISDRDTSALEKLIDIRLKYLDTPGFALEFEFSENEFFTNKVLTKTYYYQEETGYSGDYIYDRAEGDEINWTSPENNLTISVEKRKQRNKHTKATRTIEKLVPVDSFFNFFDPPHMPAEDEDEDLDEAEFEELEQRLEMDYELGEEIKDKIIPRAIDWFTGDALEYEELSERDGLKDDDFDEDEDEDEDDDDDDEDEDDDSDDDDDDESGASAAGSKGQQQPPECKQN